ncbi:hypothetical protein [Fusobacterium varium]|uniref:hypothetical protein n=1 Tax=Fusobacterium varium TaxID=856 RepID=UPI001F3C8B8C|nr:hypothetical protein [Fusobacterium varium]MCF2673356.1 hypothetical protein [Fusobacterium varium]
MRNLKIMIDVITRLVSLKEQGTITKHDIFNESYVVFKFLVNGYEEYDECDIEETEKITKIINKRIEEYWEEYEEEQAYIDQCNADYTAVCCGGPQWN